MGYEFRDQNFEPRARHPPEKREKDPLHPLCSKHPREDKKRKEDQEIETAHRLLPQDPVTEEQLRVPCDQSLIEIKKRQSTRSLPFSHKLKIKEMIVAGQATIRSAAILFLATEIVTESTPVRPQ